MPNTTELVEALILGCMGRDIPRFEERLRVIARRPDNDPAWPKLMDDVNRSRDMRHRRSTSVPKVSYPPQLPVSEAKDEILAAIRDNQVVVLAGETGSGKTTQLPKICLELGRGVMGTIGHTQPRRIAARSVAARIAEELGSFVGGAVGYRVRFTDQSSDTSLIKLMTDGILLAETQSDPLLMQYDTIIIDEAHERSLNIDFLLGYLKQLLPKRPDLKLIITSATIDPARFSAHFGDCPMLEVSGRTFPVEVRYKPVRPEEPDTDEDGNVIPIVVDPIDAIASAVDEVRRDGPGDILVFHASEREIRETANALAERLPADFEILPLYSRLSVEDQQRVFKPGNRRRVVLATNVAETSITVPNIRYVIDPGEARISRYSTRTKVQRLPIEPISQASANQRKGRCGRVAPGVCVRLYSEEEFTGRPAFTDPEILRTNLASVILQMTALKLGDVAEFPFLDPPDTRQIRDGYNTLYELGAVTEERELTDLGRRLAKLPTDPRIGRMILAGLDEGVLDEVLVIAAALSVQDPRDRPLEVAQAADAAHAHFRDEGSDFMGMLKLWEVYQHQTRQLSAGKMRRWCRDHFLSYSRLREWHETHRQIRTIAAESLAERRTARHGVVAGGGAENVRAQEGGRSGRDGRRGRDGRGREGRRRDGRGGDGRGGDGRGREGRVQDGRGQNGGQREVVGVTPVVAAGETIAPVPVVAAGGGVDANVVQNEAVRGERRRGREGRRRRGHGGRTNVGVPGQQGVAEGAAGEEAVAPGADRESVVDTGVSEGQVAKNGVEEPVEGVPPVGE